MRTAFAFRIRSRCRFFRSTYRFFCWLTTKALSPLIGSHHHKANAGSSFWNYVDLRGIHVEGFQFLQDRMSGFIVTNASPELCRSTQHLCSNQGRRHHSPALDIVLGAWKNSLPAWEFRNHHQVVEHRQTDSDHFSLLH